MSFGDVLRDARERKGYDLAGAARRLRIRPDVLRAIEDSDFERMPPRGYARNMVNAYARLVGLNPTQLTRMYLDEAYAYQVGQARSERESSRIDLGSLSRRSSSRSGRSSKDETRQTSSRDSRQVGDSSSGRSSRVQDGSRYSGENDPTIHRNSRGRDTYTDRNHSIGRTYGPDSGHPSRRSAVPTTQYTNFYSGPAAPSFFGSKWMFIAIAAVLVILLIVVLVFVLGNRAPVEEDVPDVPITGLTDTSNPDGTTDEAGGNQAVYIIPDKVTFTYSVSSGKEAYIEVYENGKGSPSVAETVKGTAEKSFDVTDELKFVTTNPNSVSLLLDGEEVKAKEDPEGSGIYVYEVDFASWLKTWQEEHPNNSANTTATNNDADSSSNSNKADTSTS